MNENSNYPRSNYEAKQFTVATGQTAYDVKTSETLFVSPTYPDHDYINIATNQAITVKFNNTAHAGFPIAANSSLVLSGELRVSNIFIANASGSTATITLLLI